MSEEKRNILNTINSPDDLKKVPEDDLIQLCKELREKIIDECSEHPGHFGAGLGVVELTVALHYVFDAPYDNIVWDVGHQAYPHKILTGRRDNFSTNRQYKGLSGFPKRSESKYLDLYFCRFRYGCCSQNERRGRPPVGCHHRRRCHDRGIGF